MPTLPTAPRRPWQPAPVVRPYQLHAERSDLYDTPLWKKVRKEHLRRAPLCVACAAKGITTPGNVLDHIVAVRDGGVFFDLDNHQLLCKPCHFSKSAKENQARIKAAKIAKNQ